MLYLGYRRIFLKSEQIFLCNETSESKSERGGGNVQGLWENRTLRAVGVPVVLLLILTALLLYQSLRFQQVLPSPGWSRSIKLPLTTPNNYYPFIQKEKNTYHIYTKQKDEIAQLVVDSKLNIMKKSKIPVNIGEDTAFWAEDNKVAYLKKDKLILYHDGKSDVLASGMDGLQATGDKLVVWNKHQIFRVNPESFSLKQIGKTKGVVRTVILNDQTQSYLVVLNFNTVVLFQSESQGDYQRYPLIQIKKNYKTDIAGFQFAENGDKLKFLFSKFDGKDRTAHIVTVDLHHPKTKPPVKRLYIYNAKYQLPVRKLMVSDIFYEKNQPVILLSGKGTLSGGEQAISIFRAEQQNGKWLATRISTTEAPSKNPVLMDKGMVLWADFKNYDHHVLEAATQDPRVVQNSLKLNGEDWSNAFGHTFSNMTVSLLIFFFACLWGLPTGLFLLVLFFAKMTMMERNPAWVKYTAVGLFAVTQLIFIQRLFGTTFHRFAPDYLTFAGSSYVIPIALIILSWWLMRWVKGKEWENISQVVYSIGLDVFMVAFLIGPYAVS